MTVTLVNDKEKRKATDTREELMDVIDEWINLDRRPAKSDDWLRYAGQRRKPRIVAP